eukprot:4991604-Prymnesium_polylepis.1
MPASGKTVFNATQTTIVDGHLQEQAAGWRSRQEGVSAALELYSRQHPPEGTLDHERDPCKDCCPFSETQPLIGGKCKTAGVQVAAEIYG